MAPASLLLALIGLCRCGRQRAGNLLLTYTGHKSFVLSVAWSPDGTHIASASDDQTVQVWEAVSGWPLLTYNRHTGTVWSVAWSPDGTRIASASFDRTVQVWEAKSGKSASDLQQGMQAPSIVWRGLPTAPASLLQAMTGPCRCGRR